MIKNDNKSIQWKNATWDGSRIAQLKKSLKLTPKQRFEALDDFIEVNNWFSKAVKIKHRHSSQKN